MSPWFPHWDLGGTTLLVETDQGPMLVDTGLGLRDHTHPTRMVRLFSADFGVRHDLATIALNQVRRLGIAPEAVRHIVMTHLHFDHAGGLPDFPHAQVHLHAREHQAILRPRGWIDIAYDSSDFAHQPRWVQYEQVDCLWMGFQAIRLPFSPEMYLIPLFGHTRGHCGVAIKDEDRWVFHCGDALPTNAEFDLTPHWINRLVLGPHVPRLKEWSASHPEVQVLAGHMWRSFFEEGG